MSDHESSSDSGSEYDVEDLARARDVAFHMSMASGAVVPELHARSQAVLHLHLELVHESLPTRFLLGVYRAISGSIEDWQIEHLTGSRTESLIRVAGCCLNNMTLELPPG